MLIDMGDFTLEGNRNIGEKIIKGKKIKIEKLDLLDQVV